MKSNNNSVQFFIYAHAQLNSRLPVTESARIQTTPAVRQHRIKQTKHQRKCDQLRLFVSKDICRFTHGAEGQWLEEQLNVVKLRAFPARTSRPTVSR
jgi:hypothetical protein